MGCIDLDLMRAGAQSVPSIHLDSLPPTTSRTHLRTVLPPLSPGFRGRGVGGEGQSASRWASGPKLDTWPRVPTLAPSGRERVFDGAAPSSPALLPREARGRREPEGIKIIERSCQGQRNESGRGTPAVLSASPSTLPEGGRINQREGEELGGRDERAELKTGKSSTIPRRPILRPQPHRLSSKH